MTSSVVRICATVIILALGLRLLSLGLFPLYDTTEARYGEMARLMWETGNWITPLFDYDVPFWGKPPLQTWVSAGAVSVLGLSEFALRLPHFLVGLFTLWMTWRFAVHNFGKQAAWVACAVLASTPVFFISIGMVMTDTLLMMSLTLAILGLYYGLTTAQTKWGYLLFAGLGLGLLAKGPLVLVLFGLSVLPWLCTDGRWRVLFKRIPMVTGLMLMLAISLPWYVLAERATPGFLEYFILGEHFYRFTVPGWAGDLYGKAHQEAKGMIWWFFILATLPWVPLLLWRIKRRPATNTPSAPNNLPLLLWGWLLSPCILFTLAGNILPAYVLPGVPALALLLAREYAPGRAVDDVKVPPHKSLAWGIPGPGLFGVFMCLLATGSISKIADDGLVTHYRTHKTGDEPLVYWLKRPFSAQFYSHGKAIEVKDPKLAMTALGDRGYVAIGQKHELPNSISANYSCNKVSEHRKRKLLYCMLNAEID